MRTFSIKPFTFFNAHLSAESKMFPLQLWMFGGCSVFCSNHFIQYLTLFLYLAYIAAKTKAGAHPQLCVPVCPILVPLLPQRRLPHTHADKIVATLLWTIEKHTMITEKAWMWHSYRFVIFALKCSYETKPLISFHSSHLNMKSVRPNLCRTWMTHQLKIIWARGGIGVWFQLVTRCCQTLWVSAIVCRWESSQNAPVFGVVLHKTTLHRHACQALLVTAQRLALRSLGAKSKGWSVEVGLIAWGFLQQNATTVGM